LDLSISEVEHKLLELKAKVPELNSFRKSLTDLKARHVGTFRQIDTYFKVPKGRLKFRRVVGKNEAKLLYYERENIPGPKNSYVFILKIQKPAFFQGFLEKILQKNIVVEKVREIYCVDIFKSMISTPIMVHLDNVRGLGTFIEFELETTDDSQVIKKGYEALDMLMKKMGVKRENLEKFSYGDLVKK